MKIPFFQQKQQEETVDFVSLEQSELNDEQLARVSGGYIIAGPAGELDWLRRLEYARTHPGRMIPLVVAKPTH
jgi:hypothetical protein